MLQLRDRASFLHQLAALAKRQPQWGWIYTVFGRKSSEDGAQSKGIWCTIPKAGCRAYGSLMYEAAGVQQERYRKWWKKNMPDAFYHRKSLLNLVDGPPKKSSYNCCDPESFVSVGIRLERKKETRFRSRISNGWEIQVLGILLIMSQHIFKIRILDHKHNSVQCQIFFQILSCRQNVLSFGDQLCFLF